jgi:hypothetical protein
MSLNWDIMRSTGFDICEAFKAQGFIFSDDTVSGCPANSSTQALVLKASAVMDELLRSVETDCFFSEFSPTEIAIAVAVAARLAVGIDFPESETTFLYFQGTANKELLAFILHKFQWIFEVADEVPTSMLNGPAPALFVKHKPKKAKVE